MSGLMKLTAPVRNTNNIVKGIRGSTAILVGSATNETTPENLMMNGSVKTCVAIQVDINDMRPAGIFMFVFLIIFKFPIVLFTNSSIGLERKISPRVAIKLNWNDGSCNNNFGLWISMHAPATIKEMNPEFVRPERRV